MANDASNSATAAATATSMVNSIPTSGNQAQLHATNRSIAALAAAAESPAASAAQSLAASGSGLAGGGTLARIGSHNAHKIRFHERRGTLVR